MSDERILDSDLFFGRVEHDLRGELSTMLAGVHYLARYEANLSPTGRQMIERVQGAGERMKKLLTEFGLAAWLEGHPEATRELPRDRVDVSALLDRVVATVSAKAESRGVAVGRDVNAAPLAVAADGELLKTALEYVVDFAVVRSRDERIEVHASVEADLVVVRVTDRAGALDETQRERLLQAFGEKEVVPRDPSARRERLGLGLAIARRLFEAHGGSLGVEPVPSESSDAAQAPGAGGICLRCALGPVSSKVEGDAGRDAPRRESSHTRAA